MTNAAGRISQTAGYCDSSQGEHRSIFIDRLLTRDSRLTDPVLGMSGKIYLVCWAVFYYVIHFVGDEYKKNICYSFASIVTWHVRTPIIKEPYQYPNKRWDLKK